MSALTATPRRVTTAVPPAPRVAARLGVRLALIAGAVLVGAMWWLDASPTTVAGLAGKLTSAGRLSGLLGAYLVLAQVLLMARLPWFERAVGFDRLVGWHRALGTNVVLLLVGHVLLVVEGYTLTVRRGTVVEGWTVLWRYPWMLEAAAGLALFGALAVTGGRAARRRLSYEAWYAVHLGAYAAVALSFLHQVYAGADFAGHPMNRLLWTGLYAWVAGCVLVCRVALPVRGWLRHTMLVERVVPEADGVVSVWVRGRNLDQLGAEPGQFLLWRFVTPGHLGTAHPYSLSAPPAGGRLRITVKAVGDHSASLARLRPGTAVLAEGPFGHFTPAAANGRRVLLIAAGSGVAPIRALAAGFAAPRRVDDVVVVYRVSREADLALGEELAELARQRRIVLHLLVGRRHELGYDPLAPKRLRRLVPDVGSRDVYVCGPTELTATLRDGLRRLGVPARRLHTEEFLLR